jgi:2,4-dichlorophenol 6-monooxygenase
LSSITVPVLIVGGGGAGLTASMLLSSYGIDSLLISKYPGTSHQPKAHVLQQKTMEVYRELGVAEPIYERGTPPENMAFTAWYAGVAGPTSEYGREVARLQSWGNGDTDPNWMKGALAVRRICHRFAWSPSSRPMPRPWDPDVSVSITAS